MTLPHRHTKAATADALPICVTCGYSHHPERRRRIVARLLRAGLCPAEIREAWPCFYGDEWPDPTAERRLFRDIRAVRQAGAA